MAGDHADVCSFTHIQLYENVRRFLHHNKGATWLNAVEVLACHTVVSNLRDAGRAQTCANTHGPAQFISYILRIRIKTEWNELTMLSWYQAKAKTDSKRLNRQILGHLKSIQLESPEGSLEVRKTVLSVDRWSTHEPKWVKLCRWYDL